MALRLTSTALLFATTLVVGCAHLGPTAEDRSASLTVVNLSDVPVCEVALAPRESAQWGPNRLTDDDRIEPDESRVVYVSAGVYGVRLNDCRGGALYARRGLRLVGARRLEFRPVGVQRHPRFGTRRFASQPAPFF